MSKETISNLIAVSLVAICYIFSIGRTTLMNFNRSSNVALDQRIELRIAHFQLEGGVREAVDAIARKYMQENPHVRIVQIPIPQRIFKNWRITQLIGGVPPDLIQTGLSLNEEALARYFLALTDIANQPNPYNRGTELESIPLRETFFDGMESGFNPVLVEYYGVPATTSTFRMFYNMDLLREVTGGDEIPGSYEEFMQLCERTKDYAAKTGRKIVPLGGSSYNASILMDYLFTGQTQKLLQEKINKIGQLSSSANVTSVMEAYWKGDWTLDSPEVRAGLKLVQSIVHQMQPGFSQLERDDAIFYFAQGGSVMIPSGTWDAISLQSHAQFPIGVGMLPLPDQTHPEYGKYAYGAVSEANQNGGFALGVTRDSKHPEVAIDFLQFMASLRINQLWTDVSKWPPAVLGVEPAGQAKMFLPRAGGFPSGFSINNLGADNARLYQSNLHLLTGVGGSIEKFVDAIKPQFGTALANDLARLVRTNNDNLRRSDAILASNFLRNADDPAYFKRLELLLEASCANERSAYDAIHAYKSTR